MSTFSTELKLEYLDDFMFKVDFYNNDLQGLKKETTIHYRNTLGMSTSRTSKIVCELMNMWGYCEGDNEQAKKEILRIAKFCGHHISFRIPLEIHRAMLLLSFPLMMDIMKIIVSYNGNIFTSDMIINNISGDYGSEVTVKDSIKKALLTMHNIGIIKRVKNGIYKLNRWPVFNVLGLATVLIAAQSVATSEENSSNLLLKGLSFELTHDFVTYFNKIDYTQFVDKVLWEQFLATPEDYSLQYQDDCWSISKDVFIYQNFNLTLDEIPARIRLSVEDVEDIRQQLKNEKNLRNESKGARRGD